MKKSLFIFLSLGFLASQAMAIPTSFTDFSKTRIKYRITGYASANAAQQAAVGSMEDLLDGILPASHMFQSEDESCKDVNNMMDKRYIERYIQKRGQYSGVRTYGFQLTQSFNGAGDAVYGAWINAQIPCVKKEKKDKNKKKKKNNQD